MRKKPSGVRSPVRNGRSRSSTSLVSSWALLASVRATISVGTPETSAASRAAVSVRMKAEVGMSTLPPMCPHFFSEASWSSKWTAGGAGLDHALHQLEGVQRPAEAGLGVGDDRREPVDAVLALGRVDLVGALQRLVDPLDDVRDDCRRGRGSGRGTCGPERFASAATCQPER